ncbi:nitrate- and nitrite sensing domain-containing protein [Actinoplanes sp. NPDC049802]|uniref:sensor histidine kinase n=1 Tax=Actinoplanes sp. NPDC049802 TaxID=3154742 RepID=UPI0033F1036B
MGKGGHTIRGRIVRMLALPVAAMLLLLSVVVAEEFGTYRLAARTDRAITLDLAMQAISQQVQDERGVTLGLLAGNEGFRAEIVAARQRVDEQVASVRRIVAEGGDLDGQVTEALEQTGVLAGIRDEVDGGTAERGEVFEEYNEVVEELREVYFALDNAADTTMRLGSESLAMLNLAKEATSQQRAFLNGVFSAGGFREGEYLRYVQLRADLNAAIAEFEEYATPEALAAKDRLFGTAQAQRAAQLEARALRSGDGQTLRVDPQGYWAAMSTVLDDMSELAQSIGAALRARAEVLLDEANLRLAGLAAVVLICVGIAVYMGTIAAHSVAGPLAELANEANRLAGERLPEAVRRTAAGEATGPPGPVRVAERASAEMRRVADAFERVQDTAYALATEQAELRRASAESLANLGRRNQNLLRRQLGFITKLEREESSPTGLANLFELDHLATRMRRNAESLLVLVGAASPRQWSRPLPLTDVIRAAVSEVEEYRRVSLRRLDEALVAGSVVSGLAHMLAELIENGLAFSPPDLDVEIHGRLVDAGYLIAICDQGVGMSEDELDRANRRLRGEGDFLTAPARFLGHYVVGRLAAEMGIDVQLARSAVTGVTARVSLPVGLLGGAAALDEPAPVSPAAALPAAAVPENAAALEDFAGPGTAARPETAAPPVDWPSLRPPEPGPHAVEVDYVILDQRPAVPAPRRPSHTDNGHTVNGLRRRTPRSQRPRTEPAPAPRPEPPAPVPDSPEAVRSRLTALRAGIQRGAGRDRRRSQ